MCGRNRRRQAAKEAVPLFQSREGKRGKKATTESIAFFNQTVRATAGVLHTYTETGVCTRAYTCLLHGRTLRVGRELRRDKCGETCLFPVGQLYTRRRERNSRIQSTRPFLLETRIRQRDKKKLSREEEREDPQRCSSPSFRLSSDVPRSTASPLLSS